MHTSPSTQAPSVHQSPLFGSASLNTPPKFSFEFFQIAFVCVVYGPLDLTCWSPQSTCTAHRALPNLPEGRSSRNLLPPDTTLVRPLPPISCGRGSRKTAKDNPYLVLLPHRFTLSLLSFHIPNPSLTFGTPTVVCRTDCAEPAENPGDRFFHRLSLAAIVPRSTINCRLPEATRRYNGCRRQLHVRLQLHDWVYQVCCCWPSSSD